MTLRRRRRLNRLAPDLAWTTLTAERRLRAGLAIIYPVSGRVAFLGLGIMGSCQAADLARARLDLTASNRARATSEAFTDADRARVAEVLLGEDGAATTAPRRTLFKREHMLTDTKLCLEEGQALGVPSPTAAPTREALTAATGLGHADDDFAAMIEPLETAAGP